VKSKSWPERFPCDYIVSFLAIDSNSPSGLSWYVRPNIWVKQGQPVGHKTPGGWFVQLEGASFKCDHIILMLSGRFPDPKEIVLHLNGDKYDNSLDNLAWTTRTSRLFRETVATSSRNGSLAHEKEAKNLDIIRSQVVVNEESPTGLSWRNPGTGRHASLVAGGIGPGGGYAVHVDGEMYSCARLVLALSGQRPQEGQIVMHLDGNSLNNRLSNLQWTTRPELSRHLRQTTNRKFKGVKLVDGEFYAYHKDAKQPSKDKFLGVFGTPEEARDAIVRHQMTPTELEMPC